MEVKLALHQHKSFLIVAEATKKIPEKEKSKSQLSPKPKIIEIH